MILIEIMRENAKRLNVMNKFMASDIFPILCDRETKDLYYEESRALSTLLQVQGKMFEKQYKTKFSHENLKVYPVTIFMSRYNGTYSGGKFIALNKDIDDDHPDDMVGSDVPCMQFWSNFDEPYGTGNTPQEAYMDLAFKVQKIETGCDK